MSDLQNTFDEENDADWVWGQCAIVKHETVARQLQRTVGSYVYAIEKHNNQSYIPKPFGQFPGLDLSWDDEVYECPSCNELVNYRNGAGRSRVFYHHEATEECSGRSSAAGDGDLVEKINQLPLRLLKRGANFVPQLVIPRTRPINDGMDDFICESLSAWKWNQLDGNATIICSKTEGLGIDSIQIDKEDWSLIDMNGITVFSTQISDTGSNVYRYRKGGKITSGKVEGENIGIYYPNETLSEIPGSLNTFDKLELKVGDEKIGYVIILTYDQLKPIVDDLEFINIAAKSDLNMKANISLVANFEEGDDTKSPIPIVRRDEKIKIILEPPNHSFFYGELRFIQCGKEPSEWIKLKTDNLKHHPYYVTHNFESSGLWTIEYRWNMFSNASAIHVMVIENEV